MCGVEWTGTGRKALEGKDFSYLSPTFLIDDDGYPDGLPERGPLAALLNEPAFREIPRIAASDAAVDHELTKPPIMSKLIFAALAISAAADNAETAAVQAIEKLKTDHQTVTAANATLETENKSLKDKVEAAEAEALKTRKDRADTLVKAAVADGRILAKDDDKQTKFRAKIEAGDTFAEEILAQLPKLNQGLDKPIVMGADGKPVQAADKFEGKTNPHFPALQSTPRLRQAGRSDPMVFQGPPAECKFLAALPLIPPDLRSGISRSKLKCKHPPVGPLLPSGRGFLRVSVEYGFEQNKVASAIRSASNSSFGSVPSNQAPCRSRTGRVGSEIFTVISGCRFFGIFPRDSHSPCEYPDE
jgi:regulator of replication initiation timing